MQQVSPNQAEETNAARLPKLEVEPNDSGLTTHCSECNVRGFPTADQNLSLFHGAFLEILVKS